MEIRSFAERVLLTPQIEVKLAPVEEPFSDISPGAPLRVEAPARPENLRFAPRRTTPASPPPKH